MSFDTFKELTEDLLARAKDLAVEIVVSPNNKEPGAHPDYFKLKRYQEKTFPDATKMPPFCVKTLITNGHTISRDPAFLKALVTEQGYKGFQLTLLGLGEEHDYYAGRRGAFEDLEKTADAALAAGLGLTWVYIMHGYNVASIESMAAWARKKGSGTWPNQEKLLEQMSEEEIDQLIEGTGIDFRSRKNTPKKSESTLPKFRESTFLVKPQGSGRFLPRVRAGDLKSCPNALKPNCDWCGASCETEKDLLDILKNEKRVVGCHEARKSLPKENVQLTMLRNGDVYPTCYEEHPVFLLGNLHQNSLEEILERYESNDSPALHARRNIGLKSLAEQYGKPECDELHTGCSICRTLVYRYLEDQTDFPAAKMFKPYCPD